MTDDVSWWKDFLKYRPEFAIIAAIIFRLGHYQVFCIFIQQPIKSNVYMIVYVHNFKKAYLC